MAVLSSGKKSFMVSRTCAVESQHRVWCQEEEADGLPGRPYEEGHRGVREELGRSPEAWRRQRVYRDSGLYQRADLPHAARRRAIGYLLWQQEHWVQEESRRQGTASLLSKSQRSLAREFSDADVYTRRLLGSRIWPKSSPRARRRRSPRSRSALFLVAKARWPSISASKVRRVWWPWPKPMDVSEHLINICCLCRRRSSGARVCGCHERKVHGGGPQEA